MTRTSTHRYLGALVLLVVAACGTSSKQTSDDTRASLTTPSPQTEPTGPTTDHPASSSNTDDPLPQIPEGIETFTPRLVVYPDRIVLDDDLLIPLEPGKLSPDAKAKGPNSMVMTPLQKRMSEMRRKSPMIDTLVITGHTSTPYRLITEIMFTATEAGFERFAFQTFGPGSDKGSEETEDPRAPARRAK